MTFVTTSEWRQCTTQLVWPPRCSSPQRWENNMMFAFDIFYPNLYQVSEYIFWGNLNSEIMKGSFFRWQVSNCRSVWSAGGKDLKTCKQLWDQKSQHLVCHSFGRLWGSSTFSEIGILKVCTCIQSEFTLRWCQCGLFTNFLSALFFSGLSTDIS